MYNKVPANMNFVEREKNIEKFWEDEQIFKKSIDSRKQGPTYTFYDGPPTANGNRTRADPCYQGYDSEIPRDEGLHGSEKGWMGYPRSSG